MNQFNESAKELKAARVARRADIHDITFVALDTETTGLHGYQKHRSPRPQMFAKDFASLRQRLLKTMSSSEADATIKKIKQTPVQVVEVAAIAFRYDGQVLGKFHEYVEIPDESSVDPKIFELIKWSDEKKAAAKKATAVFDSLRAFVRSQKNPIVVAHNAPFDLSIIKLHSEREGASKVLSGIPFIDTRKLDNLRTTLAGIEWGRKITKGKEDWDRSMAAFAKAMQVENEAAHTAIADTTALMKSFLKLISLARR